MGCSGSFFWNEMNVASTDEKSFHYSYKVGKQIGQGGYSTVYEVICKKDNKRYAAKVTPRAKLTPEDEKGLRLEVDILKNLQHPHIVSFVDFFEDSVSFYFVLELLEGGELFDRIILKSFYNEGEARDLVVILLNAVKYYHDRSIVHRDLKPENLLMTSRLDDANIKIVDFGFARFCEGFSCSTLCGSPGYVAPELLERRSYGKPVDMWAIGVITYLLLGGCTPFQSTNRAVLFRMIKNGEFEFSPEYWSNVSEGAKDLIRKLLTVDETERLTADQALNHSWLLKEREELAAVNLDANLKELKKFQATRKFRAAANAVIAMNRLSAFSFSTESITASSDTGTENETRPPAAVGRM